MVSKPCFSLLFVKNLADEFDSDSTFFKDLLLQVMIGRTICLISIGELAGRIYAAGFVKTLKSFYDPGLVAARSRFPLLAVS